MKTKYTLSFFLTTLFCIILLSCSKDDIYSDNGSNLKIGQIEIKAYPSTNNKISFSATAKRVTVDWGNGKKDEFVPNGANKEFVYEYPNQNFQTIIINAENITHFASSQHGKFHELRLGNMPQLEELSCSFGELTVLEISKAESLQTLNCSSNKLTELSLGMCKNLTTLNCSGNSLTSLDVSEFMKLKQLHCSGNQLNTLNMKGCNNLETLICSGNSLTSLDVSEFMKLKYLYCPVNQLKFLNVGGCDSLEGEFYLSQNQFSAESLNFIFESLPIAATYSCIYLIGNPGTNACDKSIAHNKNWFTYPY